MYEIIKQFFFLLFSLSENAQLVMERIDRKSNKDHIWTSASEKTAMLTHTFGDSYTCTHFTA